MIRKENILTLADYMLIQNLLLLFQIQHNIMQLPKFIQILKLIDTMDPIKLPQLVSAIKVNLDQYSSDYSKLDAALFHISQQVTRIKDIKPQYAVHCESLLCQVIRIALKYQFKVGSNALRFIFNLNSQLYKISNLDQLLAFPIGKSRPLEQFYPAVGENCDVVKPYITSTSVCGWTRCTIKEIQNNKYTVQYANSGGQTITRERPWFAPLGTRMKDYQWRMGLDIGSPIQAYLNRIWYKATVAEISQQIGCKKVRVTFRRFAEDGDRIDSHGIRFFGLPSGQDQWMQVLSPRIQQCGKVVDKKLCYYSSTTTQQYIMDDLYDIIFEQQYKQKPFYAIARTASFKSAQLLTFVDYFVANKGLQTILAIMDDKDYNDQIVFTTLAIAGFVVPILPRMYIKQSPLQQIYHKIVNYLLANVKNLIVMKIEIAYFAYDFIGRRLFSLSEIHRNENQLRKLLIKQFLKMNMQKQMLAVRYLNDLIHPKKPLDQQQQKQFHNFLIEQRVFQQVFNANTHEQILARTGFLLNYMIKNQIISAKQFASLWTILPVTDTRGRATIQKLLTQISKNIPIKFVEILISKILLLKEAQLTIDNLNLLKQLKNREIQNEVQLKILGFLWDILTVKSANIKTNIQEETQKVFKAFISTVKDWKIRVQVLQSMALKLQQCKKIRNQIQLLKDFIKSYPEKLPQNQMVQQNTQNIPKTIFEAISFLKTKGIYSGILNLLFKTKEPAIIKDILQFFTFLFQNDKEDVKPIIKLIYQKIGPISTFLEWVQKLIHHSLDFIVQLLQKTTQFSVYQNLNQSGFNAIGQMIINVNQKKKNLKIIQNFQYKPQKANSVGTGPTTGDAYPGPVGPVSYLNNSQGIQQDKDKKFIGPLLPQVKKHIYVLVSPFKLIGMKFLQHLLHVVKQSSVYNSIIKTIIQFITNLDESIQDKTKDFRKQFLFDVVKQIRNIIEDNKFTEQIKTKILTYINIFTQIFGQTEKIGLGQLQPHFEKITGEKISLNIDNLFDKQKNKKYKESLPKITLSCNQNSTLWSFKKRVGEIILERPQNIDVIKYTDPINETNNSKSLSQLLFYDNQSIKIKPKPAKLILRASLLNQDRKGLSQKFQNYVNMLFKQYKNPQINGLEPTDMQRLSKQKWRGTLFKQKDRLKKVFQEFDKDKKGYLSENDFKQFFIDKASKNQSGVWVLINLSGYKNNFTLASANNEQQIVVIKTQNLPRKILSCPEVYNLIFSIFENENFKQLHLSFYRLLCMLEVNKPETDQIQKNIYSIIEKQQSIYALCYSLEVINSQLSKKTQFYFDFWKNNGIKLIALRIQSLLRDNKSIYQLDLLMKNQIIPGFIRIFNMYVSQLLWPYKVVRFINKTRLNTLQLEQFVAKINQIKQPKQDDKLITDASKLLLQFGPIQQNIKDIYATSDFVFQNLLKNFLSQKSDYLSRLTAEVVRVMAAIIGSNPSYHNFKPINYTYGIKNGSLNNRRSTVILIYIYLFHSIDHTPQQIETILNKLLQQLPSENKVQNGNYFSLLNQIISKYLQVNSNSNQKDQFFISLGNQLMNRLFQQVQGEARTDIISDKVILGILVIVETLIKKNTICIGLSWRVTQITQKCLFAYNIQEKLKSIEITQEMLTKQKQDQHFKNYVICKTEDTRNVAYNIVASLHKVSPAIEPLYFNNYILPIIKNIGQDIRLTASKSSDVGLKNFGSTCYMNSMLQVINSVGPFRNSLMKCQSDSQLIKQLKLLFASLFFSERIDYAPSKLLTSFNPPINPGIQQDTTQFLNFLFDQLETALSPTKYKMILDQIFKGANTVQMICHSCGYKKQNRQQFFCFGVQIDGKFDLQSALQGSYQGEIISDYLCDKCQNRGQTTKRNILSQIPSVMFIHLRRIVFNYDMFVNMKIHTRLQFPQQLNIQPYTKQGVQLRESLGLEYMKNLSDNQQQMKKFQQLAQHGKPKDFYKMKLKGVIVHSGSADVGHYYSILPNQKVWRKYDDSRITFFGASSFENECYGGTFTSEEWGSGSSGNAYVLIYEKVVKNPLKIQQSNGQMQEQRLVPYEDIKTYNSPQHYRQIWLDNHNFMVENQLLQPKNGKGFINFLCHLLNDTPSSNLQKIQIIAQIIYRISFHSGIVGDLLKIVNENISQVNSSLFYTYVVSDKARTFKLLFNYQKPVRQFMASFLHVVLIESYKKSSQITKLDIMSYTVELINSMTGQIAKNWLRIDGFFELLYKLVASSVDIPDLWNIFMEKRFISNLIDYIMEKQSPVRINPKNYSLGTKSNPMNFSYGISIIKFYVLRSYGFNGKNYEVPAISESQLFHLNDYDVICLSFMQFYKKMLRQRQNLADLGIIIQRLCIMNLQFSKAICQAVLQAIGSITDNKDQMQDLSGVVLQILKIRDDFWINRAQMLLGIGQPFIMNQNVMNTFDEERYIFSSVLYDIFPIECLFSYVYLYRLKNTLACFQLMRAIIQGCSVSDIAIEYLARQPSPTYLFPNYLTWMQNFIDSFISFLTTDNKLKQRLQGQVEYIKRYVADVHTYVNQHPEVDYYKAIITGQIVKKREMNSFEKDGIQIKLYQYEVYSVKSQPKLKDGNLAFEPYLDSLRLTKNISSNSNILKFLKKPAKPIALNSETVINQQQKQIISLFDTEAQKPATTEASTTTDNKVQQKIAENHKKQIQQQQAKIQNQIEQQVNIEGVQIISYFRQLELLNKSKQKKVVRVVLNAVQYPNMIVPKELSWKIFPKNTQSIWLSKQNPENDWGELQLKTHVDEYIKQKHEKKNITFWWFKNYGNKQGVEPTVINKIQANQQPMIPQPQQSKVDYSKDLDMSQINCPVCTCFNPASNSQCQVCGSPLH